jgi:hypothetical protein
MHIQSGAYAMWKEHFVDWMKGDGWRGAPGAEGVSQQSRQ